jgi:hypothetical protein
LDAGWLGCEGITGGSDRLTVLADGEAGGLGHGGSRSAEKNEGKKSHEWDQGTKTHLVISVLLDTKMPGRLWSDAVLFARCFALTRFRERFAE